MASDFSHKTTVSLYRFDSEAEYWRWANANSGKFGQNFRDVFAIVRGPEKIGGYDLFFNGRSLTATQMLVQRLDGSLLDITDGGFEFDGTKQYLLKSFKRDGNGQKARIVLEEFDMLAYIEAYTDSEEFGDAIKAKLDENFPAQVESLIQEKVNAKVGAVEDQNSVDHQAIAEALNAVNSSLERLFELLRK